MRDVNNSADVLDSRDVQERIDELAGSVLPWRAKLCDFAGIDKEEDFATHSEATEALAEWLNDHAEYYANGIAEKEACEGLAIDIQALAENTDYEGPVGETSLVATIESVEVDEDEADELAALLAFKEEAENYCDWDGGETLVRESYWTEYVEELLADIGDLPRDLPGYIVIDWEKTADNIKVDYTEAEFDGVTYLFRCH